MGIVHLGLKELDQIFQKESTSPLTMSSGRNFTCVAPFHRFLPIRHRLRTGTLFFPEG